MYLTILLMVLTTHTASAAGLACYDEVQNVRKGGVDILPWSNARPFPWDNISGFWKLGEDDNSYIYLKVLSTTNRRKILNIRVYGDGICSKPYAKGTGYIDASERNVVRSILSDGNLYKYQMKLAMFNASDLSDKVDSCSSKVMAASMQVIGRVVRSNEIDTLPLDPNITETHNMLLKKVPADPDTACKK
jgi:hypothetical protein